MNVRIENQNLRFKISEKELTQLLDGHCVHTKIVLMDKTLIVCVNPTGHGAKMEGKLVLDQSEVYLNLLIPPSHIQELSDMGRSHAGLEQDIDGMAISLQVDVRADTRKVSKT